MKNQGRRLETSLLSEIEAYDKKAEDISLLPHEETRWIQAKGELLNYYTLEEKNLIQKSKLTWLKEGDENTHFFHRYLAARRRNLFISELQNENGESLLSAPEIGSENTSFYSKLYTESPGDRFVPCNLRWRNVSDSHNVELIKAFTLFEIWGAIKIIEKNKAPSPDGFTSEFFITFCPLLQDDFVKLFSEFHCNGHLNSSLTENIICLIRKKEIASQVKGILIGHLAQIDDRMNGLSQTPSKSKPLIAIFRHCESLLRRYAASRSLNKTKIFHAHTITCGILQYPISIHLRSNLAVAYAFCGCIPLARKVFDELSDRSLFLWNAIIKMYVDNNFDYDALKVFDSMISLGKCWPDKYSFPLVIKACSKMSMLDVGVLVHGRALVSGFSSNMFVQNSLIAMYMNCGRVELARQVFDAMSELSVVSWNTMINGWFQNGHPEEALVVFNRMMDARVEPDSATMVSVLPCCGYLKELELGRKIHKIVENNNLQGKIEVRNALVDMYSRCGCMDEASLVFAETKERDVVTWTSMINGYIINGDAKSALALCSPMQVDGVVLNVVTLASLLSACASLCCLKQGQNLHAWVIRKKLDSDVLVVTALIDMYAKCNDVSYSLKVFAKTSKKRTVPWNALLSGLIHNGLAREAVGLFKSMLMEEVEANQATFNSVIPAYAVLADLKQVMNLHSYLMRSGFISRIAVITGLIDIYSKCGSLNYAHKIFDEISYKDKDIIVWSVVIAGYGLHGYGEMAVSLFNQMVQSRVKPNEITFTSVLHACSHRGLVDDGLALFKYMIENYPSSPRPNHYTCIVDLLGRAGRLDEAYDLIRSMPFKHNHSIWGALLGACLIHQNVELGEVAAKRLFEIEPENTGNYILLANIYATVGRWRDAEKVRHMMCKIGLRKMPAQSSVGVVV